MCPDRSLPFDPLAPKLCCQTATQRSQKDRHEPPDANPHMGLQGAGSLLNAANPTLEALGFEAFLKLVSSTFLATLSATRTLSLESTGTSQLAATYADKRVQLPALKSGAELSAGEQPADKGRPGILPSQASSDPDPPPQAASGGGDVQMPLQPATAYTEMAIEERNFPCSRLNLKQLKSVRQAASNACTWSEAAMHSMAVQGVSQQLQAAHLEQAEHLRRELQSILENLDQGLSNCKAFLVTLVERYPSQLASRLPDLLRTGDESLQPLQIQQCDEAWQAAQMCLRTLSPITSSCSSSKALGILKSLQREMCWIKTATGQMQSAYQLLLDFKETVGKIVIRPTPAKKPGRPAAARSSAAEYESQLQRSTAAAAVLLEQDEAEKAAEQLKHANAGKKAKAHIKQHQARSKGAKSCAFGNPAPEGEH